VEGDILDHRSCWGYSWNTVQFVNIQMIHLIDGIFSWCLFQNFSALSGWSSSLASKLSYFIYDRLRSPFGLKSVSTPLTSLSQITVRFRVFSNQCPFQFWDLWPIYWLRLGLGHVSVTSLDVNFRKWEVAIDLRIGCQFENLKKDIDLRIGRRFENLKKGHRSGVQMSVT
jgi:hypothetical protein